MTIKIRYKNGHTTVLPQGKWDDYKYIDGVFIVAHRGRWVGMYSMDSITSIEVDGEERQ